MNKPDRKFFINNIPELKKTSAIVCDGKNYVYILDEYRILQVSINNMSADSLNLQFYGYIESTNMKKHGALGLAYNKKAETLATCIRNLSYRPVLQIFSKYGHLTNEVSIDSCSIENRPSFCFMGSFSNSRFSNSFHSRHEMFLTDMKGGEVHVVDSQRGKCGLFWG